MLISLLDHQALLWLFANELAVLSFVCVLIPNSFPARRLGLQLLGDLGHLCTLAFRILFEELFQLARILLIERNIISGHLLLLFLSRLFTLGLTSSNIFIFIIRSTYILQVPNLLILVLFRPSKLLWVYFQAFISHLQLFEVLA